MGLLMCFAKYGVVITETLSCNLHDVAVISETRVVSSVLLCFKRAKIEHQHSRSSSSSFLPILSHDRPCQETKYLTPGGASWPVRKRKMLSWKSWRIATILYPIAGMPHNHVGPSTSRTRLWKTLQLCSRNRNDRRENKKRFMM